MNTICSLMQRIFSIYMVKNFSNTDSITCCDYRFLVIFIRVLFKRLL